MYCSTSLEPFRKPVWFKRPTFDLHKAKAPVDILRIDSSDGRVGLQVLLNADHAPDGVKLEHCSEITTSLRSEYQNPNYQFKAIKIFERTWGQ